jgi:hypothetical protein
MGWEGEGEAWPAQRAYGVSKCGPHPSLWRHIVGPLYLKSNLIQLNTNFCL